MMVMVTMIMMMVMVMVVVIKTLNFLMTGQSFSVPRRAEGEEGSRRNLEGGEMEGGAVRTSPIFSIFVYFDNNIFQIFVLLFHLSPDQAAPMVRFPMPML